MRISLSDIQQMEKYLSGAMDTAEKILFETRLNDDAMLKLNLVLQKKVYSLLGIYHRKKLKQEVEEVHRAIFNDPAKIHYQESIYKLFKF
jgi:hypothetical protein